MFLNINSDKIHHRKLVEILYSPCSVYWCQSRNINKLLENNSHQTTQGPKQAPPTNKQTLEPAAKKKSNITAHLRKSHQTKRTQNQREKPGKKEKSEKSQTSGPIFDGNGSTDGTAASNEACNDRNTHVNTAAYAHTNRW